MKFKFFLFFIGLVFCSTVLFAQMIDEAILISAARISRELPVNSTAGIIYFSSNSSNFNEYILNELNGAILRNRRVVPSRPKENQKQSIEANLRFDNTGTLNAESAQSIGQLMGVQYLITGTVQLAGSEYRLIFNVVNTSNTEEKYQYSTQVDLRNDQRFNQRNFGDLRNLLSGSAQTTSSVTSPALETEISIIPAEASVARGWIQNFNVTIVGSGNFDQRVTWTVDSSNENTNINNNGLLTVAPDETRTTLTIKATSVINPKISGTATVSIRTARVTEVIVNPETVSVVNGKKYNFNAVVSGDEEPPQNVTWSVTGASSSKTTISNNGILSVASNETGTKITVQATSVFDNQKNGTADVSIIIIPPPKNWISIEGSIIGFGIRYERSLSTTFNLGLMFFLQMNDAMFVERSSFILDGGLLATFRFFPGNSIFFLEIGAGYGGNYDSGFGSGSTFGFMVYPAVGLQLGKKAKGIFFNAFFGVPIIIEGDRTTITNSKEEYDKFTSISIRYGIGLGYKW